MNKKNIALLTLSLVLAVSFTSTSLKVEAANAIKTYETTTIAGQDRYETSNKISLEYIKSSNTGVILALGENFPDALSGSVLAQKYKMPILLAGPTTAASQQALSYIEKNLSKDKTIYILGGTGGIKEEVQNKLSSMGYSNIKRLGGLDRFETNAKIIDEFSAKEGTPIVIASGENFPDALSISSIAAVKGYPVLLVSRDNISDVVKEKIKTIKPSQIFVIGGTGSVSETNLSSIKAITGLEDGKITRLWGNDRYETSLAIAKYFNMDSDTITFASGEGFADALSGSVLSAQKSAPLLLVNNSDVSKQKQYVDNSKYTNEIFFGGDGVISKATRDILSKTYDPSNIVNNNPKPSVDNMSVSIADKEYNASGKTVVKYDKVWTFTFSEPVDLKDLDIKIGGYGQRSGVEGYYYYSAADQANDFVFQQTAPNQIKIFKGSVDKDGTTYNDGYENGDYRITVKADSKAKSGNTLGKDYQFDFTTVGAGGIIIN